MAALTVPAKATNTIGGDQELTIKICDITSANAIAERVLELGEQAAKITHVHIDTTRYFQATEEAQELTIAAKEETNISLPPDPSITDTEEPTLCAPLITILDLVKFHDGGLTSFIWPAPSYTDQKFTRPPSFWTALYAHAPTLTTLHLDFFCHEVHTLRPLPLNTIFTALRDLRLDTSSAHGDNGSTVDALLNACPNLEILHFEWPPCDLGSCQIENISWGWKFPKLAQLYVFGWNFAPAAYTDFLVRHTSLTSIEERVDGPWDSNSGEYAKARLPVTALPNLQTLKKDFPYTHKLRDYFEPTANRPISTLALRVNTYQSAEQGLIDIATSTTAQENLRTLELSGDIRCWRAWDTEHDSSDDETETVEERQQRREEEEQDRNEQQKNRLPDILKTVIPSIAGLEELSFEMDSTIVTYSSPDTWTYPDPMNMCDLVDVLGLLPKARDGRLKLLRLKDPRAKADALEELGEYLNEQCEVLGEGESVTGSLQVLQWCGEEKRVYSFP